MLKFVACTEVMFMVCIKKLTEIELFN